MLQEIDAFALVIIASGLIFIIVAVFLIGYYKYSNKLMKETVKNNELKIKYHKDLLKSEIDATEKERTRLARDLHDEVGAMLSYISMNMSSVEELISAEDIIRSTQNNKASLDTAIQKVREISQSLLPPTLDLFGLDVAVEEFINNIESEIKFSFSSNCNLNSIPKNHLLHLYRIVTEFINNSIKHSKCTEISIQFNETASSFIFDLKDNGIGYDYEQAIKKNSSGIKNFESRLNAIDADYSIKSDKGVAVNIILSKNIYNEH